MTYSLLRFGHLVGLALISAGLIGVFLSDLRSRRVRDLSLFGEAIRSIAVFYDGLVVPGAVLLLLSGAAMTWLAWGGWNFVNLPWLVGMVVLFALEFVEGNTITRLYFMRLRRLTRDALDKGQVTPDLDRARREHLPTFTHFLDLPLLLVIVSLGTLRPTTWTHFAVGTTLALVAATTLSLILPRLYPWTPPTPGSSRPL